MKKIESGWVDDTQGVGFNGTFKRVFTNPEKPGRAIVLRVWPSGRDEGGKTVFFPEESVTRIIFEGSPNPRVIQSEDEYRDITGVSFWCKTLDRTEQISHILLQAFDPSLLRWDGEFES